MSSWATIEGASVALDEGPVVDVSQSFDATVSKLTGLYTEALVHLSKSPMDEAEGLKCLRALVRDPVYSGSPLVHFVETGESVKAQGAVVEYPKGAPMHVQRSLTNVLYLSLTNLGRHSEGEESLRCLAAAWDVSGGSRGLVATGDRILEREGANAEVVLAWWRGASMLTDYKDYKSKRKMAHAAAARVKPSKPLASACVSATLSTDEATWLQRYSWSLLLNTLLSSLSTDGSFCSVKMPSALNLPRESMRLIEDYLGFSIPLCRLWRNRVRGGSKRGEGKLAKKAFLSPSPRDGRHSGVPIGLKLPQLVLTAEEQNAGEASSKDEGSSRNREGSVRVRSNRTAASRASAKAALLNDIDYLVRRCVSNPFLRTSATSKNSLKSVRNANYDKICNFYARSKEVGAKVGGPSQELSLIPPDDSYSGSEGYEDSSARGKDCQSLLLSSFLSQPQFGAISMLKNTLSLLSRHLPYAYALESSTLHLNSSILRAINTIKTSSGSFLFDKLDTFPFNDVPVLLLHTELLMKNNNNTNANVNDNIAALMGMLPHLLGRERLRAAWCCSRHYIDKGHKPLDDVKSLLSIVTKELNALKSSLPMPHVSSKPLDINTVNRLMREMGSVTREEVLDRLSNSVDGAVDEIINDGHSKTMDLLLTGGKSSDPRVIHVLSNVIDKLWRAWKGMVRPSLTRGARDDADERSDDSDVEDPLSGSESDAADSDVSSDEEEARGWSGRVKPEAPKYNHTTSSNEVLFQIHKLFKAIRDAIVAARCAPSLPPPVMLCLCEVSLSSAFTPHGDGETNEHVCFISKKLLDLGVDVSHELNDVDFTKKLSKMMAAQVPNFVKALRVKMRAFKKVQRNKPGKMTKEWRASFDRARLDAYSATEDVLLYMDGFARVASNPRTTDRPIDVFDCWSSHEVLRFERCLLGLWRKVVKKRKEFITKTITDPTTMLYKELTDEEGLLTKIGSCVATFVCKFRNPQKVHDDAISFYNNATSGSVGASPIRNLHDATLESESDSDSDSEVPHLDPKNCQGSSPSSTELIKSSRREISHRVALTRHIFKVVESRTTVLLSPKAGRSSPSSAEASPRSRSSSDTDGGSDPKEEFFRRFPPTKRRCETFPLVVARLMASFADELLTLPCGSALDSSHKKADSDDSSGHDNEDDGDSSSCQGTWSLSYPLEVENLGNKVEEMLSRSYYYLHAGFDIVMVRERSSAGNGAGGRSWPPESKHAACKLYQCLMRSMDKKRRNVFHLALEFVAEGKIEVRHAFPHISMHAAF